LVDDYQLPWNEAWNISTNTFACTNHNLLPEALEKWRNMYAWSPLSVLAAGG
jgi:glucan phosphorylase